MRSQIRSIRPVYKNGAFGNPNAMGSYIYGKRRDGRTVACRSEQQADGGMQIFSAYHTTGQEMEVDVTDFTADEWKSIRSLSDYAAARRCNEILDARKV